jgi:hypothetical protein
MADEPDRTEELGWLLQPAEPGLIHMSISAGEGATLPEELREALAQFMRRRLPATNVQDLAEQEERRRCRPYFVCQPQQNCDPLSGRPCFMLISCRIADPLPPLPPDPPTCAVRT